MSHLKLFFVLTLVLSCVVVQARDTPFFEEDDCPFDLPDSEEEGETILCGYLIVPENRAEPDGVEIELAVAILFADGDASDIPVVYLEGGPGGSALSGVDWWYTLALRQNHDIVLVDQRGTGFSNPTLDCPEIDETDSTDAIGECAERLESEGVDLAAYTSAANAADINDLAIAMNYDQIDLFGVSYGTRLALTIMRDYPERIRSVILDGVYPPHIQGYDEQASNAGKAFDVLFAACAQDNACNQAFPDLDEVFYVTVDSLNDDPALLEDEFGDEIDFTGENFVEEIFSDLYDTAMIPYLPLKIYAASEDDWDTYSDAYPDDKAGANETEMEIDGDSDGMFYSVECAEEVPFNTLNAAREDASVLPPQLEQAMLSGIELTFDGCAIWNVPPMPPRENEPVRSDIPTLVLSGAFDPITPPSWGQAAADYLPNSYPFVFPTTGHGAVGAHDCPTGIALDFLDNPNAKPASGCIEGMRLEFVTD